MKPQREIEDKVIEEIYIQEFLNASYSLMEAREGNEGDLTDIATMRIQGYTNDEIAQALELSLNQVNSRLFQIRKVIRETKERFK